MGGIEWNGGVLDFFNDKLYQVGFLKSTTNDDRTTFNTARTHLTDLYGDPIKIQSMDSNLMWRSKNGNIVMLEYVKDSNKGRRDAVYNLRVFHRQQGGGQESQES